MRSYKPYPKAKEYRSGIKVSWYYYETKETAMAASEIAIWNRDIDRENGYDHGYCSPGEVRRPYGPGTNFYPHLWEVCTC